MSKKNRLNNRNIAGTFIEKENKDLSILKQTELLSLPRSSVYYKPLSIGSEDIEMMKLIDEAYTDYPFYGSRKIAKHLSAELNMDISRKRIQRLMRLMGIEALYPKPSLSKNNQEYAVYPYLLSNLNINRSNQVWGTDITYIKLKHGFIYLVAFLDWFSRFVVSWNISDNLENEFCLEASRLATENYGLPQIENSDQGSQFTSNDYIDFWKKKNVSISMDGRGRCMDNIFTERLWRTLKYEEVYLKDYQTAEEAEYSIKNYFNFYNNERIHQSLNYQTPAQVYFKNLQ